jgi:predicted transcriptional regulator
MARRFERTLTEHQREWLEHVQACRARGLSLKAYAEQAGLDVQRLYRWHRRLKQLGLTVGIEEVDFAAVQVRDWAEQAGRQRLHFPNGLVLEWGGTADLGLVGRLLELSGTSR